MAKRDIDFLLEVGSLKNIPRAWQQQLSYRVQNVPEHVFRMSLVAWIIALNEGADVGKVLQMCMLHDLAESRATDIAFMHRDYVKRDEELAANHLFNSTTLEKEAHKLLKEYDDRTSLEAKVVKDADNIEVDFELKELAKYGDTTAIKIQKVTRKPIRDNKLYTKTAKKMWDELQKTDADDWHMVMTGRWVKNRKSAK